MPKWIERALQRVRPTRVVAPAIDRDPLDDVVPTVTPRTFHCIVCGGEHPGRALCLYPARAYYPDRCPLIERSAD